jgi:D-alanyl-D-alanine carboxypeptidase/D-alanyl-D-alanine-endopeptidase (penicillin-binding protein 4)
VLPRKLQRRGAALLLLVLPAFAQAEPNIPPLHASLDRAALRPPARSRGVSIQIAELETGQVIYERNPDRPETIASVTKMFSTAAALHFLGPDYKFKTTFWRRGDIKEGQLLGSVLVVGGGDPNISGRFYNDDFNAVFDQWAEGLKKAGVTRIAGDLVLNSFFFDSVSRNPEWPVGQEAKWYQAPISALSYNDNVVYVSIKPGQKPGLRAEAVIEPENGVVRAVCTARTVGKSGRARVAVVRQPGSDEVSVTGTVPSREVFWTTPIAIDDAVGFFGSALKNRLKNAGIELTGSVAQKDVKPDNSWTLVAATESDLLPTLAVTNKRSQGFYAEQIFKTLGAVRKGQGSWPNAVAAEKEFLESVGLDPSRYDLHDGSGLSPNNKVAAGDLVNFLRVMARHPSGALWKNTLAEPGDPIGTLRHRLLELSTQGRIWAKTGSISGVSTLAGYVTADSGKKYAFAILLNGGGLGEYGAHAYQDRLIRALVKNG